MFDIETAFVDVDTIDKGTWIELGAEFPGVEIHARGFSSKDAKALYDRLRRECPRKDRMANGQVSEEANDRMMKRVIIEKCLIDWRGFSSGGKPLAYSKDTARSLLDEPKARRIAVAIIQAVGAIDDTRATVDEDAEKN